MINNFDGEYAFLSNFYECQVIFDGIVYQSSEAAFQAQKTLDLSERKRIATLTPGQSKKAGRKVVLRSDWESVKTKVMYEICKAKFMQNPDLKEKLLETGAEHLEEGNTWGDTFWGTMNGFGKNRLGCILMQIREELRNSSNNNFAKEEN